MGLKYVSEPIENLVSLKLKDLIVLWEEKREGRAAPAWNDIGFESIPSEFLSYSLLIDVIAGGDDYNFRFFGSNFAKLIGIDLTGKSVDEAPSWSIQLRGIYDKLVANPKVSLDVIEVTDQTVVPRLYRTLRLPLSSDGTSIDKILTVIELIADQRVAQKLIEDI